RVGMARPDDRIGKAGTQARDALARHAMARVRTIAPRLIGTDMIDGPRGAVTLARLRGEARRRGNAVAEACVRPRELARHGRAMALAARQRRTDARRAVVPERPAHLAGRHRRGQRKEADDRRARRTLDARAGGGPEPG